MTNPFPYSLDNKRYHTWNYAMKNTFKTKIAKVAIDGHFTCPNRDGTLGFGGCLFCPSGGANQYPGSNSYNLINQYEDRKKVIYNKWKDATPVPYFQSFSNTYDTLENLRKIYTPFLEDESPMLFIATRVDCINDEILDLLKQFNQIKPIWLEFGLQSTYDETLIIQNCLYTFDQAIETINKCHDANLKISIHLINGFPNETKEMMINNAKRIAHLPIDAIKFHTLLILKNSQLEKIYKTSPFHLLTQEEAIDITINQLEYLPKEMIIERVTSDAPTDELIGPLWVEKKTIFLNNLDKEMLERDTYQGKKYESS